MFDLQRHDDVFVLTMDRDDNRFNLESLAAIGAAFDEVEAAGEPSALVVTGTGKFFSNGLDLEQVQAGRVDLATLARETEKLMARTLTFGRPTVAAINGHAFAAAAMWSTAFDHRVMRADRGFWCLPEVDLGIPFTQGMNDLLVARLSPPVAHRAMCTGHRYGGDEAHAAGIVEETAAEIDLLPRAIEAAAALAAKPTAALSTIKQTMYAQVVATLAK